MYCPRCGAKSKEADKFCHECGLDLTVYQERPRDTAAGAEPGTETGTGAEPRMPSREASSQETPIETLSTYEAARDRRVSGDGTIPYVPSYLGWAIAVLLLCFFPTGIAAVVYAMQVENKLASGDVAGAQRSSRNARTWCWISFAIAVAGWIVSMLILTLLGLVTGTFF